jgi:hypothetical protein
MRAVEGDISTLVVRQDLGWRVRKIYLPRVRTAIPKSMIERWNVMRIFNEIDVGIFFFLKDNELVEDRCIIAKML